ncbi:hypothetical protein MNBD_ALPHA12-825 [hydrothermal vent metagenome]|uniref:Transmembrane protein (PGPGW) n=1 Tax=hydrothermal vent metagenome TaxID=652676 RepID=A0A3B0UCT5_9ZZZZ
MPDNDHDKEQERLNRQFEKLEAQVPGPVARFLRFLRRPAMMLVRIPLGVLLVIGGIFSILPLLGIWMLPLGLLLLAVDLAFLRKPVNFLLVRILRWWQTRKRSK